MVSCFVSVGIRPEILLAYILSKHGLILIQWVHTQTSQGINTINVHRATSADALSAASSERKSRINLILDSDQSVQHHRARLVQIQCVALHARLRGGLIGIPAVDVEGLGSGFCLCGSWAGNRCHSTDG